jgi:hypothetical protein
MGKSRVIVPKRLSADPVRMGRAITNTLNSTALGVKADFGVTVQTFDDKPTFAVTSPTPYQRQIATDDANYARLNDGTRPHTISPSPGGVLVFRTPFESKTLPRSIMSRSGRDGGDVVFTRKPVNHPGTAPRDFDTVIAQKWDRQFATIMQRAIDSEV